ncbi:MAG TPA: winged helix-turn-helix domain-containing protein [Humisphaera sp.]|jgi:hypothetical protein|nr:winged helix-turn-helix domain-containing protein [Humisphaera sp.]
MSEQTMGLQRIEDEFERGVRWLGVAGSSFSDVVGNMLAVINADPALVTKVREMGFARSDATPEEHIANESPSGDEWGRRRARKGEVKTFDFYKPFVLRALLSAPNHTLRAKTALKQLEPMLRPHLKAADYASLPKSGAPRWPNRVQWARLHLVEEGLLQSADEAGRGVWRLTAAGVKAAQKL